MLILLLSILVIFVPDIAVVSSNCSSSTVLTAGSSEDILEEDKAINLECEWTINSTDHVEMNITEWSLDGDKDSLSIYDGDTPASLLIAKLYNQGTSLIMISSGKKAYVKFKTGHSYTGKGFRMSYRSYGHALPKCDKLAYQWPMRHYLKATEIPQRITSRHYPDNYPINTKEEWVIIKPSASSPLAIVIEDMDIEDSHTCGYDYIALFNGKCATDKKVAHTCGRSKGTWTVTGRQHVLIRFKSDSATTAKGFKLKYYLGTVEDPDADTSTLHAILIGLITACIVVIFLLASAKLYMRCFKQHKVRPNQNNLQNRRAMLEARIRRGPNGSRLNRMMTAQSIHAEMTRYLNNSSSADHDSRVSTFEISTSPSSGLVYQNGMFQPPSYSTLFNHEEEQYPDTTYIAPPPYPGSPDNKQEENGRTVSVGHLSPMHNSNKENGGLADVETTRPPPYNPA